MMENFYVVRARSTKANDQWSFSRMRQSHDDEEELSMVAQLVEELRMEA